LLALVQRPGRVLDKSELIDAVWPDTVVEENNLTQNISAIRKALGEQRGSHVFVVTVPGRGYSFVAEVREVASNGSTNVSTNGDGHTSVALEKVPLEREFDSIPPILNEVNNGGSPIQTSFSQLTQLGKRQAFAVVLFAIAVATLGSLWFLKDGRSNEVDGSSCAAVLL
jgi:DNA-binding winged helix-turn-helix (wHTH) protein